MSAPAGPSDHNGGETLPEDLPCGRALDDLIEQVAHGHGQDVDEHQQNCTHCRAYLTEIERLWAPVTTLAGQPVEPPPHLLDQVMTVVRELAMEIWHAVIPGDRGVTRIAARVLARMATRAAGRAPGVRVVLGRSTQAHVASCAEQTTLAHEQPGSAVGIAGQHAVIDLAVVTSYGVYIPHVADAIRQLVVDDLRTADLHDVEINITVDDVIEPQA